LYVQTHKQTDRHKQTDVQKAAMNIEHFTTSQSNKQTPSNVSVR
jgi:hypothetical protein